MSVDDRGFQLGDGVFETVRVAGGTVLELSSHASRLQASADFLEIPLPDDLETYLSHAITEVCRANHLDAPGNLAAIRITVSRGSVDGRMLLPPRDTEPNLVVQAWQVEPVPRERFTKGIQLTISAVRRHPDSPLAMAKTTSRAEFVYALLEARRAGADDALFLTTDGFLAEATSASIFVVEGEMLATPSLDSGILVSTTREWVIASGAPEVGLSVRQDQLLPEDLFMAEEAFLASSVAGIVPVTMVDGRPIGTGKPGPRTLRLRELRESAALDVSS